MRLTSLDVSNFRSHEKATLTFQDGINILYGRNGTGKTNLLEAIHYLCLTRSFLGNTDETSLKFGTTHFEITGNFQQDFGLENQVRIYYAKEDGKNVFVDKVPLESFSKIVGRFPVVSLSPYDIALTQGTPSDRRKFLDTTISQASKLYLEDLVDYKRVLTQRNKLLYEIKNNHKRLHAELEIWDETFVNISSSIVARRIAFAREFNLFINTAYTLFTSFTEQPESFYEPEGFDATTEDKSEIKSILAEKLVQIKSEELRRGTTLIGPHRDDVAFKLNGYDLKKYASQGQHKTFVVALKLAQFFYLRELLGERPIFLLDDVFSELDSFRVENLMLILNPLCQSFISTTEKKVFGVASSEVVSANQISIQNVT
jgi:DNA replication and repair protein RecF